MRSKIVKTCPLFGGQAKPIATEGISYPLAEYKCTSCGAAGPRQGGTLLFEACRNARSAFDEWAKAVQEVQGC